MEKRRWQIVMIAVLLLGVAFLALRQWFPEQDSLFFGLAVVCLGVAIITFGRWRKADQPDENS